MCFLYRLRGMPSKRRFPRNSSHSGVLSNRECGGWTSQPPVMNASIQCSPDRSMLMESALNTWCTRKSRQTRSMAYTDRLKCAAPAASATADLVGWCRAGAAQSRAGCWLLGGQEAGVALAGGHFEDQFALIGHE